MSYIKVDHSKFETAASAMDSYIAEMKRKMTSIELAVKNLNTNWEGSDQVFFMKQWETVLASESTYSKMVKECEEYAKYLRFAGGKYKDAQANAINRANNLPKY